MSTTDRPAADRRTIARRVPPVSRRWLPKIPLVIFGGLAAAFAVGLTMNPAVIPSPLIGKPVPEFVLPPISGRPPGLSSADLHGEVTIVNVFASWCTACREEHPYWMRLSAEGTVPVHGLDYKDAPDNALAWLRSLGDPYEKVGSDRNGRVAIDFGVYGVPETFVIGRDGRVAYKHIGPVNQRALEETILPLVRRLRQEPAVTAPVASGSR
ncbi:Cytochrome c-type biogenesis protein CcmG/DsbE, thiol:disulfide oxidoreductase [Rhodovulum sp. PH10]|uniref:DsbE family thiol:disulfide interchange protein n=1 Tax=Rhodovulum sp. PH10 TaxID=1187851 RepID=UPI00027C255E|nr:DsbE family thiol:disulfide interchange protein [Rhodovulum sp. PH10]EJW10796.1 Cytochrome c-type biogenesis protein CcmG/DsbE, thiol:disulfide oxidoreductase [Rhodovulum sp. PH10]